MQIADRHEIDAMGLAGVAEPVAAAVAMQMRNWYKPVSAIYETAILCSGIMGLRPIYAGGSGRWRLGDTEGRTYRPGPQGVRVIEEIARTVWVCAETGREIYITHREMDLLFEMFFEERGRMIADLEAGYEAEMHRLLGKPGTRPAPCPWCGEDYDASRQAARHESVPEFDYCSAGCYEAACEELAREAKADAAAKKARESEGGGQ